METEKKKLYLSLPMTGQMDTLNARLSAAYTYAVKYYDNYIIMDPVTIASVVDAQKPDLPRFSQSTGMYLSMDIMAIIDTADAILLCPGWENSKGCRVEHFVACEYGKRVFYMDENK